MFFFFICGEHTFRSEIPGYEGMVCQCHHCGNMAAHVVKSRPFFTFCFVSLQPIIPFTISGYKDVTCNICHFQQPLENRPDVMAMANRGSGGANQGGGQYGPPPPQGGQQRYG
ncbi:rhodopsin family protein [Metarhizium acridum CQMa 102]|uniref:Rhodopsin family protein n=1 Tax=Metarhizium acridum (strain CQMa 102) TaxID=655827 RepID=E9ECN0_METAQ|nr:rhodopsin family protein [Metarhizium acridum CQMa 102]EFY86324.1 rhodopsin family protein [Metarhizium acridum CQMa 102]